MGTVKAVSDGGPPSPLWGPFVNMSVLQVKLNGVFEGLNVEVIALAFHLDRAQLCAWKTPDSLGHDYLEFMDQRNMAAREGGSTPAPQRSVKLLFRDKRKLRMEAVDRGEVLGSRVGSQGDV